MEQAVGFDELRWLQELEFKKQRAEMPERIGSNLLTRQEAGSLSQSWRDYSGSSMKAQMKHVENAVGRVLVGPKKLRGCYARIVSQRDGSGRIEKFNPSSRTWSDPSWRSTP